MNILSLQTNINTKSHSAKQNMTNTPLVIPQNRRIKDLTAPSYAYFYPAFKGVSFEDNVVRQVKGKEYYGDALYENNYINFDKVGWSHLSKENFDITTATNNEIYAFQHALALGETADTSWVKRFNPFNVDLPLATSHTLCDRTSKQKYADNLKILLDTSKNKELDVPLFNKKGKLKLDCIVWDTETTGLNTSDKNKPLDKIIQIGSIQLKDGVIDEKSKYNQLINPEMYINERASLVHGIYDKDIQDKPTMTEVLPEYLNKHLNKKNGLIVAYNSKFDMTMVNNAIDEYNQKQGKKLSNIPTYNVLDPFILTQRIHPFVGAKKKLSEQYKYLFCKNLDNAHDAFADVKGTVDVLRYDLYYLNNHRKDKEKPLTVRDVLIFQNGSNESNINIPLNHLGCNDNVKFNMSYRLKPLNVVNYSEGYKLTEDNIPLMESIIGSENGEKLRNIIIPPALLKENDENADEQTPQNTKSQKRTIFYTQNRNYKKILKLAKIQEYQDLSRDDVIDFIVDYSKNYINNESIDLIYKNTNPKDIKNGNDMPDFNVSKKVMLEHK